MKTANTSNVLCLPNRTKLIICETAEKIQSLYREKGVNEMFKRRKEFKQYNSFIITYLEKLPTFLFPKTELLNIKTEKQYEDHAFLPQGWEKLQYHTATENKACLIQFTVADHSSLLLSQA